MPALRSFIGMDQALSTGLRYRQVVLDYIPDGFRNINIAPEVTCDVEAVLEREGDCFVGRVDNFPVDDDFRLNHLHIRQKKVYVKPGELLPLILCYRRSIMELSSLREPYSLRAGDRVTMLGGDGYAGSFQCALATYGSPVTVEVLGAITGGHEKKILNSMDACFLPPQVSCKRRPYVVAVLGVRMDSGKSTTIRRLVDGLSARGLALAIGKVSGFGCLYETAGLHDGPTIDFTDFGLPSTCGFDVPRMLETAGCVLDHLSATSADVVLLEFGGGLIDPYHVDEIYRHLSNRIDFTIFVAFDLCGVRSGKEILSEMDRQIDIVSGPLANTSLGVDMIKDWMGLASESNQSPMEMTCEMIAQAAIAARCFAG